MPKRISRAKYVNRLKKVHSRILKAIEAAELYNGHDARALEAMRDDIMMYIRANVGGYDND